jgi:hypothetical protein
LQEKRITSEEKKCGGIVKAIKDFIYGFAAHESALVALKSRAAMEQLFMVASLGGMLGVPVMPPYYSLRLLPYLLPRISAWKRSVLKQKDLTDIDLDI